MRSVREYNCYMEGFNKHFKRDLAHQCRCFWSLHKRHLALIAAVFVVCMVIGIITNSGSSDNSINYIIIMRSGDPYSVLAAYFKTMLIFLLGYVICLIGLVFPRLKFVGLAAVAFVAFRLGMKINVCIAEDVWLGVLIICIHIIPSYVTYVIFMCIAICIIINAGDCALRRAIVCRAQLKVNSIKVATVFGCMCAVEIIFELIIPSIVKLFVVV